jgi:hypothetical protein
MSIPAQPSPAWTDNVLDPMRQLTDPLADAVVAEAFQQGQADAVNALMRTLIENDDLPSDQLPQGIRDYLATSAQMPAWADPARIQAGERVFWRYGPEIILNLFCYGLPSCYAGAKGVQVLALTTRLFSSPTRRVVETAQMVVDVMAPGGLAANGRGVRTAQKSGSCTPRYGIKSPNTACGILPGIGPSTRKIWPGRCWHFPGCAWMGYGRWDSSSA